MRQAKILYKGSEAGLLSQYDDGSFSFEYNDTWFKDSSKPSISINLSKKKKEYHSIELFPFFYNMLPEGANKQLICKVNRIDVEDSFALLCISAEVDNIGAIQVIEL
jgi:serine/threonine-protein kinase HipA